MICSNGTINYLELLQLGIQAKQFPDRINFCLYVGFNIFLAKYNQCRLFLVRTSFSGEPCAEPGGVIPRSAAMVGATSTG